MTKKLILLLILLFTFSLLSSTILARKGVGIVWDTETEIVTENLVHCVQYGIYNPWEEGVNAILSVSSELKDVITTEESETKFIKAGTTHDIAAPIEFCFKVAKTYEEDCLIGNLVCEQKCEDPQIIYEGKIVVMEMPEGTSAGAAGSATALGVSVPLKLKVRCDPHPREWTLVYVVIIVVVIILIFLILLQKRKNR